ncbi:hypothetical protein KIPB_008499, partial [Kipferlia bialata]
VSVVVLDNYSTGHNILPLSSVTYIEGDILDDDIYDTLPSDITHVVHLAAAISVAESMTEPDKYERINVQGSEKVYKYAQSMPSVKGVISASSAAIYGDPVTLPCREVDGYGGISPYADTKWKMELLGRKMAKAGERGETDRDGDRGDPLRIMFMRPFNVYGPRQDPKSPYTGVISTFMGNARTGQDLTIFGDGEQTRDFVFVRDLVRAALNVLLETSPLPEEGASLLYSPVTEVYNIGTGTRITVNTLAETVVEIAGRGADVTVKHGKPREGDVIHSVSCVDKLRSRIGWAPADRLQEGLTRTWQWFMEDVQGAAEY